MKNIGNNRELAVMVIELSTRWWREPPRNEKQTYLKNYRQPSRIMHIAAACHVKPRPYQYVMYRTVRYLQEASFEEVVSRVRIALYRFRLGDGYGFVRRPRLPPRPALSAGTKHSITVQEQNTQQIAAASRSAMKTLTLLPGRCNTSYYGGP